MLTGPIYKVGKGMKMGTFSVVGMAGMEGTVTVTILATLDIEAVYAIVVFAAKMAGTLSEYRILKVGVVDRRSPLNGINREAWCY